MKKLTAFLFALLLGFSGFAQERPDERPGVPDSGKEWWNANPSYVQPIPEVYVTARRPMKEIGMQQTKLDSAVLKENIALSMA
ncbi:MAG: TonB-dependent receptor, partial [Alistipes sp.]|nr:TonB-dependent receptor [Alistipes sp.]